MAGRCAGRGIAGLSMWNICEQPWTLAGAAVLSLFVVLTVRSVLPEKRRRWQWLIPVSILGLAFLLDRAVETDPEKVDRLIKTAMLAAEEEDCDRIEALIDEQYQDSFHAGKAELMRHCREVLSGPVIRKNILRNYTPPRISGAEAVTTIFTTTHFEQNSYVTDIYQQSLAMFKVELRLRKQPDGSWRIGQIRPLEANKQRIYWRQLR